MAVIAVHEIWSGRSGNLNDELRTEFTRTFRIQTNNMSEGAGVVLASVPVSIYDPYTNQDGSDKEQAAFAIRFHHGKIPMRLSCGRLSVPIKES